MLARSLGQVEHCKDIGLERPPQLLVGNFGNVFIWMLLTCIVDENVDFAEFVYDLIDDLFAKFRIAEVPFYSKRCAAFLFDNFGRLVCVFGFLEVNNRNVRAFSCEQSGSSTANAAVSASDNRDFIC